MVPIKAKFEDGITIYPNSSSMFDIAIRQFTADLILNTARSISNVNIIKLAEALGRDRNSLTRIMDRLRIRDDFDDIKRAARKRSGSMQNV